VVTATFGFIVWRIISAPVPAVLARPNTSIEQTCHGGLCLPRPAAHVKR
jgi:hypothetical protein